MLRLCVAALLGAAIGTERDIKRRPAGIRTSLFVCLASALFTILSNQLAHTFGDTSGTRIVSNLVQGIGFLGAGAIIRESGTIVGMTTAATIFVEAAIGMAAGGGFYAVAAYTTGVVLFALVVLGWVARWTNLKPRMLEFRITTTHPSSMAGEVHRLLQELKVNADHFRVSASGAQSIVEFGAEVGHKQEEAIVHQLNREGIVTEIVPLEARAE